uniref:uncharacterized protein LOC120333672 n=1 Tax=Styela clava TaxID=7725 RepID=UPI001939D550|nr:uncharacterized protein LOC120333672 [Styela clava]
MERRDGPPPQYRTRRRRTNALGCTCDCNYARSLQGICKVVQICIIGLAWIMVAASPYWRPIFVMEGITWPFHVVMLLSIWVWLSTIFMYCLFMSGYHLSQSHKNWPKIEFIFNMVMVIMVLIAAALEAGNVWRWDMSRGSVLTGGTAYSSYYQYGLRPGMSFTQTLNFNSYCAQRPYDCSDYFNLLAGNNSYYTNHLFAVVLLIFGLIAYLVSTFFAWRTWRVFERDMYKPGEMPKPTVWMRMQYRVEKATNHVRDKANKLMRRNADNENAESDEEAGDDIQEITTIKENGNDTLAVESGFEKESSRSDGRRSRAHSHMSHHTSHTHKSSHSDRKSRHTSSRYDENDRSSRSSSSHHHRHKDTDQSSTGHRSHHSTSKSKTIHEEAPPPYASNEVPLIHAQPVSKLPNLSLKKGSKKAKKGSSPPVNMSPVASVMI